MTKESFERPAARTFHDPIAGMTFAFRVQSPFAVLAELETLATEEREKPARVAHRIVGEFGIEGLIGRVRLRAEPGDSPLVRRDAINAACDILAVDRQNLEAAQALVDWFDDPVDWIAESAVRGSAEVVRSGFTDKIVVRTPAFEILRAALRRFLDFESPALFVAAMPFLLPESPAAALLRCANLLRSSDYEVQQRVANAMWENERVNEYRELLDAVRRDWLRGESDLRLLLVFGHSPHVPTRRVKRIITAGLAGASPIMRMAACCRCVRELDPDVALRLLQEATDDEPDELVAEHIVAALNFVERFREGAVMPRPR